MALPATLTPSLVGMYCNWARTGPANAYANWLGDVAKENDLLSYCQTYGILSIRIYDLQYIDSGSNFTPAGIAMLRAFIAKAHNNYGITEVLGVRNIFSGSDGINATSDAMCIINYNNLVNPDERFDGINIENEPWNFVGNPTSPSGTLSASGTTITGVGCAFTVNTAVNHFIGVAGQFRQVIAIANNNSLTIDRPFSPNIPAGSTWQNYNTTTNGTARYLYTVHYDTYIYRADLIRDLCVAAGIIIELYISRNSSNSFLQQLASVCPATEGRIAITQFQANPNYNYDRNATQQICSAGIPVKLAFLCSVESTTFRAGCDDPADPTCVGSPDTNSNFLGYWIEGRNTLGVPTWPAKSILDLWKYLTYAAPYTNNPMPSNLGTGANPALNEEVNASVIANATFEGIIFFTQGILRQLVIEPPDPLSAGITVQDNVSCNGLNDGAITCVGVDGTAPYDFDWVGPGGFTQTDLNVASSSVINLAPGLYTVTVTDAAAEVYVISNILITEPNAITIIGNTNSPTCNGGANGSITGVVPSGGSGTGYTYLWAHGPVTANVSGLTAGVYTLTVTDSAGCTGVTNFVVSEPLAISFSLVTTHPTCFNNNDGSIVMSGLVGGSGVGYTFAWTGPGGFTSTSQNLANLNTPGVYTCIVTDSVGCTGTNNDTIIRPTDITKAEVITLPSVYGAVDAAINLTPAGGPSGVWTYVWNGPGVVNVTTQDLNLIAAGTYNVVITDGVCSRSFDIVVGEGLTPLTALIDSTVDPICFGIDDGEITAHAVNGTAPYDFAWTGPGGYNHTDLGVLTSTITGLAPGIYHLVVTDAVAATSSPADPVLIQNVAITNGGGTQQDCTAYGANDGFVHPVPAGGSGVFTSYAWTGPSGFTATTQDIDNLIPGNYDLTVTDDEGCTQLFSFTILEGAAPPLAANPLITNVACFGSATGAIDPQITGGSGSYGYSWADGPTTATRSGLIAGVYTVTVTDLILGGAPLVVPIIVSESADIVITAVPVYGGNCGSADLNIIVAGGPAGTVSVELFGDVQGLVGTGLNYVALAADYYTVVVKIFYSGRFFCTKTANFYVYRCLSVTVATEDVACKGGQVGIAQLFVLGGSGSVTYLWAPGGEVTNSITNQFAGTYTCAVTDTVTGEVVNVSCVIQEPYVQLSVGAAGGNPSTTNGTNGWAQALPVGGFGVYTYLWNDPLAQTTQIATNLPAGTYVCIVTDSGKCSEPISVTLVDPPSDVLVPVDETTKWIELFDVRYDKLLCCHGEVTRKLSTALQIGDPCISCLTFKAEILRLIINALGRWSYERTVTAGTPAVSGNIDMADNGVLDDPTYLEWTLQVNGNTIATISGYYASLYAAALAAMIAAINSDGRFTASNILPDIGFKITDNNGQGSYLNNQSVVLSQRYTALTIDPILTQVGTPPLNGTALTIAYDPVRKYTYIPDQINHVVLVYDINDALIATIPVGNGPTAIIYRPDTLMVYVFCISDNTCHKISNVTNVGNFAISPILTGACNAVYDPSSQKVVVSEQFDAGAPLNLYMYSALDVETIVPLVLNIAHSIVYDPVNQRVLCFPKNVGQPMQLNTTTGILSPYALTYPVGVTNVYNCIFIQDGAIGVNSLFIQTQLGLLRYNVAGAPAFITNYTNQKGLALTYNSVSKIIVSAGSTLLMAVNIQTGADVIPFAALYPLPTLSYGNGVDRGLNGGKNTIVIPAYYFGGSGLNTGYVINLISPQIALNTIMSGGIDSFNTFVFDTCLDTTDQVDELFKIADQICCDGCMGCG